MGYDRVPCGQAYGNSPERAITLQGWVVEGQQDSEALQRAWWSLVNDWPILAARLRLNHGRRERPGREKWDYEIPDNELVERLRQADSSKTPSDKTRVFTIVDHRPKQVRNLYAFRTASDLPTDRISVCPAKEPVDLWASNRPTSLDQLLTEDRPVMSVHVAHFQDATMICLALPEVLGGDFAAEDIAASWMSHLKGGKAVRDLNGLSAMDEKQGYTNTREEPPAPVGWRILSKDEQTALGARVLQKNSWRWVWRSKKNEMDKRVIFIPLEICSRLKEEAIQDIGKQHDISLIDVLAAWMIKNCYRDKAKDRQLLDVVLSVPSRCVTTSSKDLESLTSRLFRRNAATISLPTMSAQTAVSGYSLGQLALMVHDETARQTTSEALNRHATWKSWAMDKMPYPGSPKSDVMILGLVDDDRVRRFSSIDFSTTEEVTKVLKIWGYADAGPSPPIITMATTGMTDPSGGIWASATLSKKQWIGAFGQDGTI